MKHRYPRFLKICLLALVLFFSPFLVAFGTGAATKTESMPWISLLLLSNKSTITISGKATIPNYAPAGNLVVLVDGLDGNIYGAARCDKNGNYTVTASVPEDLQQVYVLAVDPNDPNYYVAGYVSLVEVAADFFTGAAGNPRLVPKDLNHISLADSFIFDYTGVHGNTESQARSSISAAISSGQFQPKFCEQRQIVTSDSLLVDLAKKYVDHDLSGRLRAYTRETLPILDRLRKGGSDINSHITSSNYVINRVGPAGLGLLVGKFLGPPGMLIGGGIGVYTTNYNETRVTRVRNAIDSFDFSTVNLQPKGWTTQEHLAAAVTIIFRHGYGNCQEKGLVAAYFASLFDTNDIRQVAHVVATTGKHSLYGQAEHSFAIACEQDHSVYNLQNLPDAPVENDRVVLPQAFYDAGCFLVDPWAQYMVRLNQFEVDAQEWAKIDYIMEITQRNQGSSTSAPRSAQDSDWCLMDEVLSADSCPVDVLCDLCSSRDAMNSQVCQAWVPLGNLSANQRYYYLFKRSGVGYRKYWAGYSAKHTGFDYFYQYIYPDEANTLIRESSAKFSEANAAACAGGPAICPCAPYPDIWEHGKIELVNAFNTVEELAPYRCDNHHYGPHSLICNMWNEESQPYPGFWPNIDGICGN